MSRLLLVLTAVFGFQTYGQSSFWTCSDGSQIEGDRVISGPLTGQFVLYNNVHIHDGSSRILVGYFIRGNGKKVHAVQTAELRCQPNN